MIEPTCTSNEFPDVAECYWSGDHALRTLLWRSSFLLLMPWLLKEANIHRGAQERESALDTVILQDGIHANGHD